MQYRSYRKSEKQSINRGKQRKNFVCIGWPYGFHELAVRCTNIDRTVHFLENFWKFCFSNRNWFLLEKSDFYEKFNHPSLGMTIRVTLDPGVPSVNRGFELDSVKRGYTFAKSSNSQETSEFLGCKLRTETSLGVLWVARESEKGTTVLDEGFGRGFRRDFWTGSGRRILTAYRNGTEFSLSVKWERRRHFIGKENE